MDATSAQQAQQQPDRKPLSCVHCRQRKVKCSRIYPCSQCVRQQLDCYFPPRKKHQRKQTRRQDELLGRLARLEALVGQVESSGLNIDSDDEHNVEAGAQREPEPVPASAELPAVPRVTTAPLGGSPRPEQPPRSSQNASDLANRYLGRDLWTNLCNEVEGLKQALDQPSESEDDEPEDESTPGSNQTASTPAGASHALLGAPGSTASEPLNHPPTHQISFLSRIYWSNVDPVCKILHRPTIERAMNAFASSSQTTHIDKATEALFFAIYFSALVSMPPDVCRENLGEERSLVYSQYRLAVEAALARADYLNSSQLESLQAFIIYVACLRTDEQGRSSWALVALAVRLGHALNLHRDGSGAAFTPFVAEMRRRLWWQLVILDVRAVEDRGTQAVIASESYTTRMLTNIDDADFGPDDTAPLVGVDGPTDTTFALLGAMTSNIFLYLCDPSGRFGAANKAGQVSYPQAEEEIIRNVQKLETLFLRDVESKRLPARLAAAAVRIIVLKLWLAVQYPFQMQVTSTLSRPRVSHEDLLRTALAVIELSEASIHSPLAKQFGWWTGTYVQWHPLVVALVELCTQTQGELPDRAWVVVDRILPHWSELIADTKRGPLWRPIRKLIKKARAARLESQLKGLGLGQDVNYKVMKEDEHGLVKEPGPSAKKQHQVEQGAINQHRTAFSEGFLENVGVPIQFLSLQPMDWLSTGWSPDVDYGGTGNDGTDWSTWNEFIADSNGELPPLGNEF